ncbi:MAG: hypothetical protein Q9227_001852 [Pyrenula ochraceoflavens]
MSPTQCYLVEQVDRAPYYPNQTQPVVLGPGSKGVGIPKNMSIGPSYFDSFNNIPRAAYVVMVPFALQMRDQSTEYAREAYSTISQQKIKQLEIGNEPNAYPNIHRPADYDVSDYVQQFISYANTITDAIKQQSNGAPKFEAITIASLASGNWLDM